jgi:hypothetical protein
MPTEVGNMPASLPSAHEIPPQVLDPARLAAVRASRLLDSPPEVAFDELARLATMIAEVPLAFVTVVDDTPTEPSSATANSRTRSQPPAE